MMRGTTLFLLLMIFAVVTSTAAMAQQDPRWPGTSTVKKQLFNPNLSAKVPSTLQPVLPNENLMGNPNGTISREIGTKLYERCISQVPARFTPDAHRYYCTCSSAATIGTMTRGELNEIQSEKNRVIGNKAYEKYINEVVAPCMDQPVSQIEYMYCVVSIHNDSRIYDIPGYCQCVGAGMSNHFKQYGKLDILTTWGNGKSKMFDDPVQALWESEEYRKNRSDVRGLCVKNYKRLDPFKN